jgi:hypothetical protein
MRNALLEQFAGHGDFLLPAFTVGLVSGRMPHSAGNYTGFPAGDVRADYENDLNWREYNYHMTKTQGWVLVIGVLVVILVTGIVLLNTIRKPWDTLLNLPANAATQVAGILHPTPTVYPDSVTVIQQVRSLARLETIQYSVEQIITAESGQGTWGFLFGDRLLLVAHGQVIAGIDMGKMQSMDIRIDSSNGTVSMILPPAEIFSAALENDKTYVYSRESAVFAPGMKDLETSARQDAEQRIRKAALEDGILDAAMTNGQAFLQRFVMSLGFRQVVFLVASPAPATTSTRIPTLKATATP